MGLREQLAQYKRHFEAVLAVATCSESLGFADLQWSPFDIEEFLERIRARRDPGIFFETPSRMLAVEEHNGELRFYAGGAGTQVYDQPNELGVFPSAESAVRYAEAFLFRALHPQEIDVPRGVCSVAYDWGAAE